MVKIFTTEKVKELDEYTISHEPIRPIDLVERAASVFVGEFVRRYTKQNRVIVFAGQGNNGADALAISRLLLEESFERVETYLFNPPSGTLSEACEQSKRNLFEVHDNVVFKEIEAKFIPPILSELDIVIDGLFGSGLNRPLSGGFAAVVKYINQSKATVISIDLPSGLFGEDNRENTPDTIIHADVTLTFGFPKLAFFLPENESYVGKWKILDIGIHPNGIADTPTFYYQTTEDDAGKALPPRSKFAHKGMFGHALLIAGSRGKMGASLLAAKACLRSGAGLLTVHIPADGENILQTAFPEAMLSLDVQPDYVSTLPDITPYSAIGIGPGLGKHPASGALLKTLFRQSSCPLVIDADALNLIASNEEWIGDIPHRSILTPHPKEFDRLVGASNSSYERLMKAQAFAVEHTLIVVLKGAHTATCTPDGNIYFNNSGNPGMATAGSGDVLTGIILGLLAAGHQPEEAAQIGVLIHGTAGDLAAIYQSEESLIAGDIIEKLGKAFKQMHE
ncbi:MAG: NAD(P)H-hydrate dehydratase [Tannerellaceae bacterium]|jgi:NAD(P)H-hydrate epimerase|nr:NAD(P)H-hydrate dehydratase [Tannerellaceae bacterium]